MTIATVVIAILFAALASVLAAAETAVMLLPPGRVHRLVEAERRNAVGLESLSLRPHRLRAVSALAAAFSYGSIALVGLEFGAALNAGGVVDLLGGLAFAAIGVLVVYAFVQVLPRTLAVTNPDRIGLDAAVTAAPAVRVLYPISQLLGAPFGWLVKVAGAEQSTSAWVTGPEYRSAESDEEAEREEAEEALLEAVSDFAEKVVREVMVPRTDMNALPDTAGAADAVALIESTGNTRLPVYHETVDDIRGVLYAKDLLVAMAAGNEERPILELSRAAYFVPETKPVEELLVEMRVRTHIAIVADEYGGTAGLVTLEDLLEEIVGEISDEYDSEEPLVVELGERRQRVDARLPVDDLNEMFGTDIETEADSVGGLFTEVAGRIPTSGESVEVEGLRLTVDDLEGTRIRHLIVEPAVGPETEGESDA